MATAATLSPTGATSTTSFVNENTPTHLGAYSLSKEHKKTSPLVRHASDTELYKMQHKQEAADTRSLPNQFDEEKLQSFIRNNPLNLTTEQINKLVEIGMHGNATEADREFINTITENIDENITQDFGGHTIKITPTSPDSNIQRVIIICITFSVLGRFLAFTTDPEANVLMKVINTFVTVLGSLVIGMLSIDSVDALPTLASIRDADIKKKVLGSIYSLLSLCAAISDSLRTGYEAYKEIHWSAALLAIPEFIAVSAFTCEGYKYLKEYLATNFQQLSNEDKIIFAVSSTLAVFSSLFFPLGAEQATNNVPYGFESCLPEYIVKILLMSAHGLSQFVLEQAALTLVAKESISFLKHPIRYCKETLSPYFTNLPLKCKFWNGFCLTMATGLTAVGIYSALTYQLEVGEDAMNFENPRNYDPNAEFCRRLAYIHGLGNKIFSGSTAFLSVLAATKMRTSLARLAGAFSRKTIEWSPDARTVSIEMTEPTATLVRAAVARAL